MSANASQLISINIRVMVQVKSVSELLELKQTYVTYATGLDAGVAFGGSHVALSSPTWCLGWDLGLNCVCSAENFPTYFQILL